MKKTLKIILALSIIISFLAMSIEQTAFNIKQYEKSYIKYQVEEDTDKNIDELVDISKDIILYLKYSKANEGDDILKPHFNEREIEHMRDVKNLFSLNKTIKYIGIIIYFLIFLYLTRAKDYKSIGQAFFIGPIFSYLILLVLGIFAIFDFNRLFVIFHEISFNNDLWLLDPKTDLMIQMMPLGFFIDMAKNILLAFLIYLIILQVLGYIFLKKEKENSKKRKDKGKKKKKKK